MAAMVENRQFPFEYQIICELKIRTNFEDEEEEEKHTSALDDGGDGGKAPNICCESSISFALSDL